MQKMYSWSHPVCSFQMERFLGCSPSTLSLPAQAQAPAANSAPEDSETTTVIGRRISQSTMTTGKDTEDGAFRPLFPWTFQFTLSGEL